MTIDTWLARLFGRGKNAGGAAPADESAAVEYRDYRIIPNPIRQGGQFLTAGTIVKDFPDGRREHRFIRADTHSSEEEARRFMIQKAQRLIDEVGDRLFGA
ncbi:HlyU family transcriptional regulator [Benzoatithermus flavus]|uniref:HlyU family transcriptional regulator n=1 Tax=Benzoatithermus flavus TaxID=3108223 RepID=A0ABU8Y0S0_9PROT